MEEQNPNVLKTMHQKPTKEHDMISETKNNTTGVSIFEVAASVSESKPEAYVPQLIGLGPFNHFRPELQRMGKIKLDAVHRVRQKFNNGIKFDTLVRELRRVSVACAARASYSSDINMDDEALTCVLAVDGLYLYELLRRCVVSVYNYKATWPFFRSHFASPGSEDSRVMTVRDAIMVENQIPIFAVRAIVIAEYIKYINPNDKVSFVVVTKFLPSLYLNFAHNISPLKPLKDYPLYKVSQHSHLLDLLYTLITLKILPVSCPNEEENDERFVSEVATRIRDKIYRYPIQRMVISTRSTSSSSRIIDSDSDINQAMIEEFISHILDAAMEYLPQGLDMAFKIIHTLTQLPWSKLWSFLKHYLRGEEALIPSASELRGKGIKFRAVDRIHDVKFDRTELSLHLPLITLDVNSEVVLRNLVAYEAVAQLKQGSLVLARYLELMSALLKSSEDVKILDGAIIETSSFSSEFEDQNEAVVKLFRGMGEALRATNTPALDRAIADVKGYYDGLWSVSDGKFIKKLKRIVLSFFVVFAVLLVCLAMLVWALFLVYEWVLSIKTSVAQIRQLFNDLAVQF